MVAFSLLKIDLDNLFSAEVRCQLNPSLQTARTPDSVIFPPFHGARGLLGVASFAL